MVLAHLRGPQEERIGLLSSAPQQLPQRCTPEITPLIHPTTHWGVEEPLPAAPLHAHLQVPQVASPHAHMELPACFLWACHVSEPFVGCHDTCRVMCPYLAIKSPLPIVSATPRNAKTTLFIFAALHLLCMPRLDQRMLVDRSSLSHNLPKAPLLFLRSRAKQ